MSSTTPVYYGQITLKTLVLFNSKMHFHHHADCSFSAPYYSLSLYFVAYFIDVFHQLKLE
jgi:hypothetical protein